MKITPRLVAVAVLAAVAVFAQRAAAPVPEPAPPQLMILRLPDGPGVGRWLDMLEGAAFTPVPLSDAVFAVRGGKPLPRRALAVVFQPGPGRSCRSVAAVLARRHFPAACLMEAKALNHPGAWHGDLGLFSVSTQSFTLVPGGLGLVWAADAGRKALNSPVRTKALQRLDVPPEWTAGELVTRLLDELPDEQLAWSRTSFYPNAKRP